MGLTDTVFNYHISYTAPRLSECRKTPSIIVACMHMHIFNLNVLGQHFPCSSKRGIPSLVSSFILSAWERVFKEALDSHFHQGKVMLLEQHHQ